MTRHTMLASALTLLLTGCATTTFTSSWKAPDAAPQSLKGKKVAAMVVSPNDAVRREGEDVLVAALNEGGAIGVASYTLLQGAPVTDSARVKALVQQAAVDGVVAMRPISTDQQVTYTPATWTGPTYGSFWGGYYGYGWGAVYQPGYLTTDTIVSVETLVFSMAEDRLVWAGVSRTTNPQGVGRLIRELATEVAGEMRKTGVLR